MDDDHALSIFEALLERVEKLTDQASDSGSEWQSTDLEHDLTMARAAIAHLRSRLSVA